MKDQIYKVAEITIAYSTKIKAADREKVINSLSAEKIFRATWDPGKIEHCEEFKIMALNRANHVLGISKISEGGISSTVIDIRKIMQVLIKANASAFICCHNHPSGNKQLSDGDQTMTNKLKEAGTLLEIKLLDHLIITADEYLSMADEGLL